MKQAVRFVLGVAHIAQHQRTFQHATRTALHNQGLSATAYQYSNLTAQHRGNEHWQLRQHTVTVPSRHALAGFEVTLRDIARHPPFFLTRSTHGSATDTTVQLTLRIEDALTDIVILRHAHPPAQRSARRTIARPALPSTHQLPQVAIVIDDLGWDLETALALLALDVPLSFAILPWSPYQPDLVQEASRRGRDILLHLPMEPYGYPDVDPGHNALLNHMNMRELATHTTAALEVLPLAIGVNNHMGSLLTENHKAMQIVMRQLKQRNLFFLDSRTSARSRAYDVARAMGVRTAQRHLFLDRDVNREKITQQLHNLIKYAHTYGQAIGIGHPYPETLQALQSTLPRLRRAGIAFVPVSHLVE